MADVRGEKIGVGDDRGRRDQVVDVVDSAERGAVAPGEQARYSRDVGVHRKPVERREEGLERVELVVARSGEELEADELARATSSARRDPRAVPFRPP